MRILIVEDEPSIADFLARGLANEGYEVESAGDGAEGQARALGGHPDLVILDLMLPRRSGLEVLAAVRQAMPALPVILLTARGEVEEKVAALDLGATDYVTKPFSFDELAARVRAHLRQPGSDSATRLEAAGIKLDLVARRVERDGVAVQLSPTEFKLLAHLVRHPNQVLTRDELLRAVWGYDYAPQTNIVGVYVGYLRRKLALPGRPAPIETLRSAGYRLAAHG